MGLYRRGKIWWMTFSVDGVSYRRSTDTSDKKLAEKILAKVTTQVTEGKWFDFDQSARQTLGEMIERYRREYTETKDYYQSRRDKSIFKSLYAYFGQDARLTDIEKKLGGYEQWRRNGEKPVQPATIVKELSLLRRMFNIARKQWKWKIVNPVSEIELPKVRNERVRYLFDEEYSRLFNVLDASPERWLKPCVSIAIGTGLRLSNICGLSWQEVNLFSRIITISAAKMKNDDYIGIPITDNVLQTLLELQKVQGLCGKVLHDNGKPLYAVKVQRAFRRVLREAEIQNFRFHDLRHCFCSYLRQQGVDLHTIAVLAGQRDLRMTKRYAHLNVDSLRQAASKLDTVLTNFSHSGAIGNVLSR